MQEHSYDAATAPGAARDGARLDDAADADDVAHRVSVAEILEEPLLAGWALLAGPDTRLDTEVRWVLPLEQTVNHRVELRRVLVFADAHRGPLVASELERLAAADVAAVIVAGESPHVRSARIPVLAVSEDVDYLAFSRLVSERILSHEAHVRRYAMRVHDNIAGLLHRGATLNRLIGEVAAIANLDAAILDPYGNVIAHSIHGSRLEKSEVIEAVQNHFSVVRQAEGLSRLIDRLYVVTPATTPVPLKPAAMLAWRVQLGPSPVGWVVLLTAPVTLRGRGVASHDHAQLKILLEQTASIIATEILRQQSIAEAQERARGNFIQALVHGSYANDSELAARAEHYQFPLNCQYCVLVAQVSFDAPRAHDADHVMRKLSRLMSRKEANGTFAAVIGGITVIVRSYALSSRANPEPINVSGDADEYAQAAAELLKDECGHAVPVCFGSIAESALEIRESYREARITMELARHVGFIGAVAHEDVQALAVLSTVADTPAARKFVTKTLDPIRIHDLTGDLETTLVAYLDSGGNINEAARRIHVHRNTMLSRIDKITRLSKLDIRNPNNQFALKLALNCDLLDTVTQKIADEIEPGIDLS